MDRTSVRVHSYRPPTRSGPTDAARTSSLSTLAGLLAPAHRRVPLERAFDAPLAGPSGRFQQRALPLPTVISPPGLAQWARENSALPPPASKAATELEAVRAFEHWTRRGRAVEGKGKNKEETEAKRIVRGNNTVRVAEVAQLGESGSPSKRRAPAATGAPASPLRRSQRNKDVAEPPAPSLPADLLPPPIPATKAPPAARLSLAEHAIQRCIPMPYRQEELEVRISSRRPEHESRIRYSFVDPAPPPPSTALPSKTRSKPPAKGTELLNPTSSNPALTSTRSYPIALSFLAPGRRGAWLLPISGALPYTQAAIPIWDPPPAPPAPKRRDPRQSKIYWTNDRLTELYSRIGKYQKGGRLGPVHAVCAFAQVEGTPEHSFPDHLRVRANGEFALAVRATLQVFKVSENGGDTVKFLDHANLVWVDERGYPIFIA